VNFYSKKTALAIAVSAAIAATVVLPSYADEVYQVDGVSSEEADFTNNSMVDSLYVSGDMNSITNNGLVSGSSSRAIVVSVDGSLGSLVNNGVITAESSTTVYAILVKSEFSGVIENSGSILASASSSSDSALSIGAVGIGIGANVSNTGEILNSDTIRADYSGSSGTGFGTGIGIVGDMAGTIRNDGNIALDLKNSDDLGGWGIRVEGDLSGAIINTGNVSLAFDGSDVSTGRGISAGSVSELGSIVNDGVIEIEMNIDDDGEVDGIYVGDQELMAGDIENNGRIEISSVDTGYSNTYYGINVRSVVTGSVVNNGDIVINSLSDDDAYLEGIHVGGIAESGQVSNHGLIDITAINSDDTLEATGIHVYGDLIGTLTNTGEITLSLTQIDESSSGVSGLGIWVSGELSGSLSNSGSVSVTSVSTYDYDVESYGLYLDDVSGEIHNTTTGTIEATTLNNYTSSGDIRAVGIYVGGDLSGNLVNDGQISGTVYADDNSTDRAHGIHITGTVTGDGAFTNSGTISGSYLEPTGVGSGGWAYGIEVGVLEGLLTNTGLVEASATIANSDDNDVNLIGIKIGDLASTGLIDNQGEIRLTADQSNVSDLYVEAYGIEVSGSSGSITNSGTISLNGDIMSGEEGSWTAPEYLYAVGINVAGDADFSGSVINDGEITLSGSATSDVTLYGIYVEESIGDGGTVVNNGSIDIESYAPYSDNSLVGIWTRGSVLTGGSIVNTGEINLTVHDASDYQNAWGIYVEGDVGGLVSNEGSIDIKTTGRGYTSTGVSGITIIGEILADGLVSNSGVIDVTLTVSSSDQGAGGIILQDNVIGTVLNSGEIRVTGISDPGGTAIVVGIGSFGDVTGEIKNTGVIEAQGNGPSGSAIGVIIENLVGGTFINEGTISVPDTGTFSLDALVVDGSAGTILNSGSIRGNIEVIANEPTIDLGPAMALVEPLDGFALSFINTGTISLGISESIDLDGVEYSQSSIGTLALDVSSDAEGGLLYPSMEIFSGSATFADGAGLRIIVGADTDIVGGDILDDVIEAPTLSLSTLAITDNVIGITFTTDIADATADDGQTLDIIASAHDFTNLVEANQIAGRSSSTGVASVMDSFISSDRDGDHALFFGSMTDASQMANAVESLAPSLAGGVAQLTSLEGRSITDAVSSRQSALNGVVTGEDDSNPAFWVTGISGTLEVDATNAIAGYESDRDGFAFGYDAKLTSQWTAGIAIAKSDSEAKSLLAAGGQNLDVESKHVNFYATADLGDAGRVNVQLGRGNVEYDSVRRIHNGSSASAEYSGDYTSAGVQLSYPMTSSEKTLLMPYVGLNYGKVKVDAYSESGAGGMSLSVDSQAFSNLDFGLGLKAHHAMSESVVLSLDAGIAVDLKSDTPVTIARLVEGGSSFKTYGQSLDGISSNLGLGASVKVFGGGNLSLRYDYSAQSGMSDGATSLTLKIPL